jgi:hypothetical protein
MKRRTLTIAVSVLILGAIVFGVRYIQYASLDDPTLDVKLALSNCKQPESTCRGALDNRVLCQDGSIMYEVNSATDDALRSCRSEQARQELKTRHFLFLS